MYVMYVSYYILMQCNVMCVCNVCNVCDVMYVNVSNLCNICMIHCIVLYFDVM